MGLSSQCPSHCRREPGDDLRCLKKWSPWSSCHTIGRPVTACATMGQRGWGTMRRSWESMSSDPASVLQPTSAVRVEELFGLKAEREAASLSLDETALVERFLSGDETAFDQIVERFQDLVFNLSVRLLGRRDEAHDLSQEVFLQV